MSWEKDMSAAAMMGEPTDVTAENTWHGFGSERTEFLPFDSVLRMLLESAAKERMADFSHPGWPFPERECRRANVLVTPAELTLVLRPHGTWPLFSAAELGPLVEFFRGGDAD